MVAISEPNLFMSVMSLRSQVTVAWVGGRHHVESRALITAFPILIRFFKLVSASLTLALSIDFVSEHNLLSFQVSTAGLRVLI